jgi:subtilase family serine protease
MKKSVFLSLGIILILAAAVPLIAQQPDTGTHVFRTPIRIAEPRENASSPSGYTPQQMRAAYQYNRIPDQGSNAIIGIVDACSDTSIESDLGVFSQQFHLPACTTQNGCFTLITQPGNICSGHSGNWALEQSLDVEWAHAMAPGAKIVLVQSLDTSDTLFQAVLQAVGAGASVVSMSWGGGEFSGEQDYDTMYFSTPGVTYFAATGDGGCGTIYPSTSPDVVAVGGTILTLLTSTPPPTPLGTNYGSETAWNGSGGGISSQEAEPAYQKGVQNTGFRTVPDVASDAAPQTGVPVYDSFDGLDWVKVGGTSVATPLWAALMTVENSYRIAHGNSVIADALPDIYQIYASGSYGTDFHDITMGSSGSICVAGTGYDYVTGVGTPIGYALANSLLSLP